MKHTLLRTLVVTFTFITLATIAQGQVYKLKSTTLSASNKLDNSTWSEWDKPTETSVLMTMDLDKDRITIYSKTTQVYDIAKYEGKETDKDGDDWISYYCVNQDGKTCRVQFVTLNSSKGQNQVYIKFNDLRYVYNVFFLD